LSSDRDIKKDANEAYNAAQAHWSQYWEEAKTDIKFYEGDHWSAKDKNYLRSQDREALTWGKCRRIVHVVTGYEKKNLLALKIDPFESSDEKTANQFSSLIMNNMFYGGGYAAMSGAFEFGSVISGMNLLEAWVDHSDDLLSGDIRFRRLPYNCYVLDPTFQDRDLDRDCGFIYTRDYFSKDQAASLLPERFDDIMRLRGGFSDSKFSYFYPLKGKNNEYNLKYDRFYVRTYRPYTILADMQTGKMVPMPNGDQRADELIRLFAGRFPQLKVLKGTRKGVDLHIFVEGNLMYSGPDPSGLDEYPFVLEAGYWTPEDDDPKYRLQGVMRCMRDPGKEVDRRRSMILDMFDGIIRQGWKAKSGSVVNPDELYGSGSAVVWLKEGSEMGDAERLQAPDIPPGLFKVLEIMDKDHDEIGGVNNEMLGSPENDNIEIAAVLAKLRTANGLTTLQGLFEAHRTARVLIGRKQIKLIQKNYRPQKVQRIIGEQPTKEFYTGDFGKYDCVPCEGVLTDSQRQMYFAQLMGWKKAGAGIPWSELLEYAPLEKKDSLKKAVETQEQAQAKQAETEQQMQQVAAALLNAQKFQSIAQGKHKLAQVQSELSQAHLDRAKAASEVQGIDIENFTRTLRLLMTMAQMLGGQPGQAEQLPQLDQMTPMGRA